MQLSDFDPGAGEGQQKEATANAPNPVTRWAGSVDWTRDISRSNRFRSALPGCLYSVCLLANKHAYSTRWDASCVRISRLAPLQGASAHGRCDEVSRHAEGVVRDRTIMHCMACLEIPYRKPSLRLRLHRSYVDACVLIGRLARCRYIHLGTTVSRNSHRMKRSVHTPSRPSST